MITFLKRKLAEVGIGNPLNALIYSSREIECMKRKGELIDPRTIAVGAKANAIRQRTRRRSKFVGRQVELISSPYSSKADIAGRRGTIIGTSRRGEMRVRWEGNSTWSNLYPWRSLRLLPLTE